MKLSGAEALVATLDAFGIRHIFGLPGSDLDYYDAIRRNGRIAHVLVRHEQAAGHMADGYARATRRVGVCDASAGPGATNLVTGISQAHSDGIPVIAILGARPRAARGRGQFQEIDQAALFGPVTKAVLEIPAAARVPDLVRRALRIATTGRPGPVALNLPQDVAAETAAFAEADFACDRRFASYPAIRIRAPVEDVERVLDLLDRADHPVIWCGGGVLNSDASDTVTALVEQIGIPAVTTYMGKGSLPENHPLCIGPVGAIGRVAANRYVLESDLVLALGSRFTDTDTADWTVPRPGTPLVQVDIEPAELGKNYPARHVVWSDLRQFAGELLAECRRRGWRHRCADALVAQARDIRARWRDEFAAGGSRRRNDELSPVHPLQVVDALHDGMGTGDVLICDSGFNQIYGGKFFEVHEAGRFYIGPRGMGTMGFSLPAAIGAKLGRPEQRYIALCGDGGFIMMLQELETARRLAVPIVVVVLNNGNLEYIKWTQKERYAGRYISSDFAETDFAAIADSFGCRGIRVEHAGQLAGAVEQALASPVATVIDVVTPMEASPFIDATSMEGNPR